MLHYFGLTLSSFALFATSLIADEAPQKTQDTIKNEKAIERILDATILKTEYSDRIFEIYALNAIQESGKAIELNALLKQFKEQIRSPEAMEAFATTYNKLFTVEELKELDQIVNSKAFAKFTSHSPEINQADQQVINSILLDIISKEGKERKVQTPFKQVEVNSSNFEAEVLKSSKPVIVDFYAEWCVPCQLLLIYLQEMNATYGSDVKFAKVDYDKSPELGKKYNVTNLPTLLFFKDGKVVDQQVGLGTNVEIDGKVKNLVGKDTATAKSESK